MRVARRAKVNWGSLGKNMPTRTTLVNRPGDPWSATHRYNSHVTYQTRRVATPARPRPTAHSAQLGLTEDDVLCRTQRGGLLRRDHYNRTVWKPALAVAGLAGDTTFHDLWHTFNSTALAGDVPISEVSRWLGHRSITNTVDLYGSP